MKHATQPKMPDASNLPAHYRRALKMLLATTEVIENTNHKEPEPYVERAHGTIAVNARLLLNELWPQSARRSTSAKLPALRRA